MKFKYSLIIAGSRNKKIDPAIIKELYDKHFFVVDEIVSGKEPSGIDKCGEEFADLIGLPIKSFPANWDKYGKSAGHKRNKQMAEYSQGLIAFWDMKSPGTKSMINYATKNYLDILVYNLNDGTYILNNSLKNMSNIKKEIKENNENRNIQ